MFPKCLPPNEDRVKFWWK